MELKTYPIDFLWYPGARMWYAVCDRDPEMNYNDSDLGCLITRLGDDYPNLHWLSATDDGQVVLHGMSARFEEAASSEAFSDVQE